MSDEDLQNASDAMLAHVPDMTPRREITHVATPGFFASLTTAGLGGVPISLGDGVIYVDPGTDNDTLAKLQAVIDADKALAAVAPDCLSLPWWRTALKLWIRTDSTGAQTTRYADVDAAIKALETAADIPTQRAGILAREQFEYANSVLRADLLKLAPAFRFTAADVDESLWRADRIRQGDLTGVWPIPTA